MTQNILRLTFITLIGLVTACSGGGGGSGIPATSVTITAANAKSVAQNAVVNGNLLLATSAFVGVEIYPSTQIPNPIELIKPIMDDGILTGLASSPVGIAFSELCTSIPGGTSGSISGDINVTANGSSGSISFNSCTVDGISISGTINISETSNTPSFSDYTIMMTGSLSITGSGLNISFSGMSFTASGNDSSGDYTVSSTYSLSGVPGGGFLVQTITPLVGNDFSIPDCPDSGQILVSGASGTQVRITAIGSLTTVEVNTGDGTFTPVSGSPFACTEIFQ